MSYLYPGIQKFDITLNPELFEDVWTSGTDDGTAEPLENVYKHGGRVEGSIQLVVNEPYKFSGIFLSGGGEMVIAFNNEDSDGVHNSIMIRENAENKEYSLKKDIMLLPRQQIIGGPGQIQCLPPGDHQFPFKFELPTNIPSSFGGGFGFIEYWIEAHIDQSPFGGCVTKQQGITIHGIYDLSAEATALVPVEQSMEENYCCLCCEDGAFGYSFHLPKKGYTHGEKVRALIELRNGTPSVAEATLKLKKVTVYKINDAAILRDEKEVLAEYSTRVEVHNAYNWEVEMVLRDQLLPSVFTYCPNISVEYTLEFFYQPTGCNCDSLSYSLDLLIGHLPASYSTFSQPIMTGPDQTYIYPQVDLTGNNPMIESQPQLPPPYGKGGNPSGQYRIPQAEPSAPPIIHQPYSAPWPGTDDRPPPPSYAECYMMTDMSGRPMGPPPAAQGISYPTSEIEKPSKENFSS